MVAVYRIASAGAYDELDLTGAGAKVFGGRWNQKGTPMVYAASSIALAALETIAHMNAQSMSFNRYVIEIQIPPELFRRRRVVAPPPPDAWDSVPPSFKTMDFGSNWVVQKQTLVLEVPSVIVPFEKNFLLNPEHPGIKKVKAINLGRFAYDERLRRETAAPSESPAER